MKPKIYIDGSEGTTGLRIFERVGCRDDIEILTIDPALRKDVDARRKLINQSDITFLCLPDAAAKEAVTLVENDKTKIIDASTAHRVNPDWAYGFAELSAAHREKIASGKRIANPGCHATGFISLVYPLVAAGVLPKETVTTCFSLTGYSGGGKKMIAQYESTDRDPLLGAPRQYALGQSHKHLKEMAQLCGLENTPVFCPVVADFYSGMEVTVPLFANQLKGNLEDVKALYRSYYSQGLIHFDEAADPDSMLSALAYSGRDDMGVSVFGNEDRIILTARFDNLGKGASGAAIQNMNILLGLDETTGLSV